MFIENMGQWNARARFQMRGGNKATWLAEDAIWLTIVERSTDEVADSSVDTVNRSAPAGEKLQRRAVNIKLSFPGSNIHRYLEPYNRLDTNASFFTGSNPAKWRADAPVWGGARYVDLYPGIDLELTGGQGGLVPRLVARPGGDLSAVRLRVEGADDVAVDGDALRLSTAAGDATWPLLRAEGSVAEAAVQPRDAQSFEVTTPFDSPEDMHRPSAIGHLLSPVDLLYGTFLGGSDWDGGYGGTYDIAVDGNGAAYVTGGTESYDFPTTCGARKFSGHKDAFVAKLNAVGSDLDYATFLGGSNSDRGYGIAVDASGTAYVTGLTESTGFPTTPGAFDTSHNGNTDAFVAKLAMEPGVCVYLPLMLRSK